MAGFKTGLALGVVATAAGALFMMDRIASQPVMFPPKSTYFTDDYISIVGSLVGDQAQEAERPVHNMVEMICHRETMSCTFVTINEIEPGLIGRPHTDSLTIRQWTAREVIADSLIEELPRSPCYYYEVRAVFDSEDVLYTRIPHPKRNQADCNELFAAENKVTQWRIGNGKGSPGYVPGN